MTDARIVVGNCLSVLATLPEASVQCVVTSPPYWALRNYGIEPTDWPAVEFSPMPGLPMISIAQQSAALGLEDEMWAFVGHIVLVFRELRRVLREDGTVWLNFGDSYANDDKWGGSTSGKHAKALHGKTDVGRLRRSTGLKPKDLCGIPWRVAFALQADGWWLRQDIVWSKPNAMPESVGDRCTKAHEYVFLLSCSADYFYDQGAIQEPVTGNAHPRGRGVYPKSAAPGSGIKANESFSAAVRGLVDSRNARSVWSIPTQPYDGAHFATMPTRLAERCILAGSRCGDTVLDLFGGSGTTAEAALSLGRRALLIDVNPAYAELQRERLARAAERAGTATPELAAGRRRPLQLGLLAPMPGEKGEALP